MSSCTALICDRQLSIEFNCLFLVVDDLVEVSFRPIGKAPVAVGFRVFWIDPDCSIKTLDGLVVLGSGNVRHATIVMSLSVIPFFQQRKIGAVDRFQVLTFSVIRCRSVGIGIGTIREVDGISTLIFQSTSKFLDRVVVFPFAVQGDAAKHNRCSLGWLGL